jgi:hypothetical protein
MLQLEEKEAMLERFDTPGSQEFDELMFTILSSKKKDEEEDNDDDDDDDFYNSEEEEEKENPFDKEPTEKDIINDDIPIINPEDDLLDDEEEIPY